MAWAITYNTFGSEGATDPFKWTQLSIKSYRSEATYASDNVTLESTRHEINATALLHSATESGLTTLIENARSLLTRQAKALVVKNGSATTVNIGAGGDEHNETPRCEFTIQEIAGAITAIVAFRIIWHNFEEVGSEINTNDVMSHWWTQTFTLEDSGNLSLVVSGVLRVRRDAGSEGASPLLGANPDRYRRLIMPTPPQGFRHKRAVFATDETGARLAYTIEYQEYPRELPGPAKRGRGRFSWRRSLEGGPGMLGIKVFDGELEGDKDASPTSLLAQLLFASMNRIIYVGTGADIILEIEVREEDIFNANIIGLRVVARGTGNAANAVAGTLGFNLLQPIVGEDAQHPTAPYEMPNAYGAALIQSVRRELTVPGKAYTDADFPKAATEDIAAEDVETYEIPDVVFEGIAPGEIIRPGLVKPQQTHEDFPYLEVRIMERLQSKTHMVALKSQSLTGKSLPYQTEKPTVLIISEYHFIRQNAAPIPQFLAPPPGSILIEESGHVSPGDIDANNNRLFNGVFNRIVEVLDSGQLVGGAAAPGSGGAPIWSSEVFNLPDFGDITIRRFALSGNRLAFPFDPRSETAEGGSARSLFGPSPSDSGLDFRMLFNKYAT